MAKAASRLLVFVAIVAAPLGCQQDGSAGGGKGGQGGWLGLTWPWAKKAPKQPEKTAGDDPFAEDDRTAALQKGPDKPFQASSMQDGVNPGVFHPSEDGAGSEGKGRNFLWPDAKAKTPGLLPDPDRPAGSSNQARSGEEGLFSKAGKGAAAGPQQPPDPEKADLEFKGRRTPWGLSKGSLQPRALAGQTMTPDPKAAPGSNWKSISRAGEGGVFYPKAGTLLPSGEGSQPAKASWLDKLGSAFRRMFGKDKQTEPQGGIFPPAEPAGR